MFRIIPHRAFTVPKATVTEISDGGRETKATLRIDGLLCSACAANVRKSVERVAGVRDVEVDLERGEACVVYDGRSTTTADLTHAVEGAVILWPLRRFLARVAGHTTR